MRNNVITLIKEAEKLLKAANITTFALDTKILLSHCLSLEQPENIIFKLNEELSEDMSDTFMRLIKRRLKFEPIAYIVGYKHFWKHKYKVDNNVLIPRPETELIIEVVLKEMHNKKGEQLRILDLGTGSGCIILSLLDELKNSSGIAVDISTKALDIASSNAADHNLNERVTFLNSNWFDGLNAAEKFDVIISNPPYISKDEWENLASNVKDFEPCPALTDFDDGLKNYKIIAQTSQSFLSKNAILVLEIGYNQSDSVQNIFKDAGYITQSHKDLQGINRVIIAHR